MRPELGDFLLLNGRRHLLISEGTDGSLRLVREDSSDDYIIVDRNDLIFDGIPTFRVRESHPIAS